MRAILTHLNHKDELAQTWGTKLLKHRVERFEVFTPVTMENGVFWDVTRCNSCKNRRFGGDIFLRSVLRLLVTANVSSSPILVTLMMEALSFSEHRFLQDPHGVTSQKMPFFIGLKVSVVDFPVLWHRLIY
jgi:hypothetical protein